MSPIEKLRFLIITGKGGVGKTTVAAAQAEALAAKGKRVLVCMCNTKERLSAMLGSAPIGHTISQVRENFWAVNLEPETALEEYGMMALKSRALYKLLFDNAYVRTFLRAVPGMHEWAMLGKAWWHTTEMRNDGTPKYDLVILDAPATGHGLDMLRVPKILVELVPSGMLRRDAEIAWKLFQNPALTGVVLVTLPEEMPTTETLELAKALQDELRIPIVKVVVNALLPPLFSKEERTTLLDADESKTEAPLLAAGRFRAMRERMQAESMKRLADALPIAATYLPLLFEDAATPKAIHELSKRV